MEHGVRAVRRHRRFASARALAAQLGAAVPVALVAVAAPPAVTTPPAPGVTTPPAPGVTTVADTSVHVDNPYRGARLYVDPEWSAMAAADGGAQIADQPTAVWLDSIAAISHRAPGTSYRTMGLVEHLDAALAQGADAIQLVLWNLPDRTCSHESLTGELDVEEIDRYRTEFVDPIAEILARPAYAHLRIITIIEPDSLPNLVTNVGIRVTATRRCDVAMASGAYVQGVTYALSRLQELPNVYTYLDAGHHGSLGWPSDFSPTARLLATTAAEATGGAARVDGIIVNTANYSALVEPFLTINNWTEETEWIDWNDYVDELSFATAFRAELVRVGLDPGIGVLIDTSRNGWGGPDRPTAPSRGTNDDSVNASRVDRRLRVENWCNQAGAGLGERPQADPAPGVDAYVWAKPPGESDGAAFPWESDGAASLLVTERDSDPMCDPWYTGPPHDNSWKSGALGGSPPAGAWFSAHFRTLLANAYPPL